MNFKLCQLHLLSEKYVSYISLDGKLNIYSLSDNGDGTELGVCAFLIDHDDVLDEICKIHNINPKTITYSPWDCLSPRHDPDPWRFYKVSFDWKRHIAWAKDVIEARDMLDLEDELDEISSEKLLAVVQLRQFKDVYDLFAKNTTGLVPVDELAIRNYFVGHDDFTSKLRIL